MIVTSCGAEALPLISAFGVLPASVAFIAYYNHLVGVWLLGLEQHSAPLRPSLALLKCH
jgi:hypothetical protein